MIQFTINYKDQNIAVKADKDYRLHFPDQKWMRIQKYPDDTRTSPVNNENISYSNAFVWRMEESSGNMESINEEALQEIGALVLKKAQELENN